MKRRPTSERDINRHCARVYLAEARRRRGTWFAPVLLQWAKNARRRSNEATRRDLFGRAA